MKYRILTCLGKGGTGKTVISTLMGKYFLKRKNTPLFVDADPVSGLQKTLGITEAKTIAQAKKELIDIAQNASNREKMERAAEQIDYIIMNVLQEYPQYGFIAIGQTYSTGCFCAVNSLLRKTLSSVIRSYEPVIIDAEAGIEQVNRLVVEDVHYAFLITDLSKRGVDTCIDLKKAIRRIDSMKNCRFGVIINKSNIVPEKHGKRLEAEQIEMLGAVPSDSAISEADYEGTSLLDLPGCSAYNAVKSILDRLGVPRDLDDPGWVRPG